jgi:hypothetical protein
MINNTLLYFALGLQAFYLDNYALIFKLSQSNLEDVEIKNILFKENIKSTDLITFYKVFNTKEGERQFDFCSFGHLLPIKIAIDEYNDDNNMIVLNHKSMFPIFASEFGDFLMIDIKKGSKTFNQIFLYSPSLLINEPIVIFDNLESFLKTLEECLVAHVYDYDSNFNIVVMDYAKEKNIIKKNNNKSQYLLLK